MCMIYYVYIILRVVKKYNVWYEVLVSNINPADQ